MNIEFNGKNILNEEEKKVVDQLSKEYYEKVQRQLKKPFLFKIQISEHNSGGKRKKYSFEVNVICSGEIFKAQAFDWDCARTIHKLMKKIETEIEHKTHGSEQK